MTSSFSTLADDSWWFCLCLKIWMMFSSVRPPMHFKKKFIYTSFRKTLPVPLAVPFRENYSRKTTVFEQKYALRSTVRGSRRRNQTEKAILRRISTGIILYFSEKMKNFDKHGSKWSEIYKKNNNKNEMGTAPVRYSPTLRLPFLPWVLVTFPVPIGTANGTDHSREHFANTKLHPCYSSYVCTRFSFVRMMVACMRA